MPAHLAIVGGGSTGTLLAIHALRRGKAGDRIVLLGAGPEAAMTSPTEDSLYLLNLPAAAMSAFASEPRDFVEWLKRHEPQSSSDFVPRRLYALYLASVLSFEAEKSAATLDQLKVEVTAIEPPLAAGAARVLVAPEPGSIYARTVVLATGRRYDTRPPAELSDLTPDAEYFGKIWNDQELIPLPSRDARVLLLGTGLRMADAALTLVSRGHRGRLIALSRRGSLPQPFRPFHAPSPFALRPHLPPDTGSRLHEVVAWRKLELKAGHVLSATRLMKRDKVRAIRIEYFSKTLGTPAKLETDLVLNCEGPESDSENSAGPLIDRLLSTGQARLDPKGLALETDAEGRVLDRAGSAQPWLKTLGPRRREMLWESSAIPEIRFRAERLVESLR